MSDSADLDRRHVWHPFTQMREWSDPLVIVEAEGAMLRDAAGSEYFDGNSSIWTNVHGHRCPEIDAALTAQLGRVAHTSFLGLTNDVAPELAKELLTAWLQKEPETERVFFSDDGSTAIEAGLKMIHQARRQRGEAHRTEYFSIAQGYHGDTVGAMSLGHSAVFHGAYKGLMFGAKELPQPGCYRCPWNKAKPVRGKEARLTRECGRECIAAVEEALDAAGDKASALVMEPRLQGAGGMTMHPHGYLSQVARLCRERGVWLMLDEVLTGFGRTGPVFAAHKEDVQADVVALGKGITGGYLPLAATLVSGEIFDAFLGEFAELKTFFHGHSYSGNQLGSAAARANLKVLRGRHDAAHREGRIAVLAKVAERFWEHPQVGEVRCEGNVCAIELVEDFETKQRFPFESRVGFRVCEAARKHGLITRNIGDVVVLMPPLCATDAELQSASEALWNGLVDVLPMDGMGKAE